MESKPSFKLTDIALNRIKLRPLVIFNQVYQSGSILHAAAELHLTQPAVTKAIHELEEQLNVKLFVRKKSGVEPTAEGQLLFSRITNLLIQLRYLIDDINNFREGLSGHLVIGTLLSASVELLPRAIAELKQSHPNVNITVKVATLEELFPALSKGEIDIVVGRLPAPSSPLYRQYPLEHTALFTEQLRLMVGKQHPLLSQTAIDVAELIDYPWIVPLRSSEMRHTLHQFFNARELPFPSNIVESMSILTNISLLVQSSAITCMAAPVADYLQNLGILTELPTERPDYLAEVGYSVRRESSSNMLCNQLIAIMQRFVTQRKSKFIGDFYD